VPPCSATVLTDNLAQARATDQLQCSGSPARDFIVTGSTSVDIDGLMAARQTDLTMHMPAGSITTGSPDVEIGGPTGGAILGSDPSSGSALATCIWAANTRNPTSPNPWQQQSYNNCGVESARQIINRATGTNINEDNLLNLALLSGDAVNDPLRVNAGGALPDGLQNILAYFNVPTTQPPATWDNIQQAVAERKGVISAHISGILWGNRQTGGHGIVVTGVEYNALGVPITVWTNDTGFGQCQRPVPWGQYLFSLIPGWPLTVTNNSVW
jgi:uncharacterized Zn-binding protein involved in type VI secretion